MDIDFRCLIAIGVFGALAYFVVMFFAPVDTRQVMTEEVDAWSGINVGLAVVGIIFLAALFVVIAFPELF